LLFYIFIFFGRRRHHHGGDNFYQNLNEAITHISHGN